MKYAGQMASDTTISVPGFIKISSDIQKLMRGEGERHTESVVIH
jgi:hypothetical protein